MQQPEKLDELPTGILNLHPAAGDLYMAGGDMESRKLCAYNQTRECFLGLEVDGADLSLAKLKDRIASLTLKSGEGLWLAPFRGLPEWGIRVPLDLLYLDQESRVIDVVESYPVFRANASTPQPASVLALPTHSIYSSQTQPGDQLVLCAAEEMQQRLERFAASSTAANAAQGAISPVRPVSVAGAVKRPLAVVQSPLRDEVNRAPGSIVQSAVLLRENRSGAAAPGCWNWRTAPKPIAPIPADTHLMGLIQPEMTDVRPPQKLARAVVVSGSKESSTRGCARAGRLLLDRRTSGSKNSQGHQHNRVVCCHRGTLVPGHPGTDDPANYSIWRGDRGTHHLCSFQGRPLG